MQKIKSINPMVRAVAVFASVATLATGVTFATFNNRTTLSDNSISTATADLKVWNGNEFTSNAPGFTVTELVPGEGSGEKAFYFKNTSSTALNVSARVPSTPGQRWDKDKNKLDSYGFDGWENLKVTFRSQEPNCADPVVETTMAELVSGSVLLPCNSLAAGATGNAQVPATEGNYTVEFDINPDAVTGDKAGVGDFDIVFSGSLAANANQ